MSGLPPEGEKLPPPGRDATLGRDWMFGRALFPIEGRLPLGRETCWGR
jgi:hypothetical protein